MIIKLADTNGALLEAYLKHPPLGVIVQKCSIFDVEAEAIVSPANSFGFMDGGLDYEISKRCGWDVQTELQEVIRHRYNGELLVGQAIVIRTSRLYSPFKYVISSPTMRVPMILPKDTVNVYLAVKAALLSARGHGLDSVVFPGMGTGVGRVSPEQFARQFHLAVSRFCSGKQDFPRTWHDAQCDHQWIYGALGRRDLQQES